MPTLRRLLLSLAVALAVPADSSAQGGFHPDGKEELVEEALFTNVWKNENGAWKLTRVLSYDHRDTRKR